jgi:CubicO group peptidase (beta-lactamase class C family)
MTADESRELLPATRRALLRRVAVGQAEGRTPSLVGAVVRDGGQVWCGSRSMMEDHEPDGDVQYRIGSLTKTFVAVLIMRLRAEGLLNLADPVGTYLDASEAGQATIAQLLSHTAGLAAEARGPWWERTPGELRPSLGDIFGDRPHPLPAGRQFHYSNPGFALLGALAGQLRGHSWDEAVRREILSPLGMTRTTLRAQAPHAGGFAVHPWADVMQPEPAEHTGHMAPAGDLWSTADDLCRFAAFLLDGDDRVLPAATLEEMRTRAAPPSGSAGGYGFGIEIQEREGRTLFGHGGSMPGFLATLWVSADDGLGAGPRQHHRGTGDRRSRCRPHRHRRGERAPPARAMEAATGHRPGTPRAHRSVVLGAACDRPAGAVPRDAGADAGLRAGPRVPVPRFGRRNLDRA